MGFSVQNNLDITGVGLFGGGGTNHDI